jgi:hypothetical protein
LAAAVLTELAQEQMQKVHLE